MIRVVIVDDQALVRGGFAALVDGTDGMTVVGQATDGAEAVALCRETKPDIVLMDIRMPNMDGIAATREISGDPALVDTRVIVLTTFDLDAYVFAALRAGASGFLLKDIVPADLLRAIQVVAGGDALLAPQVTRRLIAEFASRPDPGAPEMADLASLTDREREILVLVARGMSNHEIADELVISPLTAKTHVSRILGKLACRDRAQLVAVAYENRLVSPEGSGDDA